MIKEFFDHTNVIFMMKNLNIAILSLSALVLSIPAFAQQPEPWQLNLQPAASPNAQIIHDFHDMLLYIIFAISAFVLALLVWVVLRYNHHVNKEPAKFTHNVLIEVIWTVIPIVILIVIAVPSFKLLYYNDKTPNPEMTLEVTGYQWYWGYRYPDHGDFSFMSYMIPDKDIDEAAGQKRLLSTDTQVVLPIETDIEIGITAADVIHSWAVPALGVKMDAVPGRRNATWVRITKPGTYYGQCSELCGKDHAFMPIEIKAVTKEEFNAWVESAKAEYSFNSNTYNQNIRLAEAF